MTTPGPIDGANVRTDFFATADGTTIRSGRWFVEGRKPRGSIVLLNGRKEFLEKYTETAADLNQRGFAVFGFDWRGQGLSSRMLPDRLKGFVRNYEDYLQDLEEFFRKVVQPEAVRPLYLLAHSMGGHVALRYLHRHPAVIDKAVLVAPMLDINTKPFPRWLVKGLVWLGRRVGSEKALVPGSDKHTNFDRPFEGNALTADPRRFAVEKNAVAQNPNLALGGVTFAWLTATLASIAHTQRPGFFEEVETPVLMVAAGADRIVSVAAQKSACRRLPNCRLLIISGARHEILMETDAIRTRFWKAFDAFIANQTAHPC